MKILLLIVVLIFTGCLGEKVVVNYNPADTKRIDFKLNAVNIDADGGFNCGNNVVIDKESLETTLKNDISSLFDEKSQSVADVKLYLKNYTCKYEISMLNWIHLFNLWTWSSLFGLPYTYYENALLLVIEIYNHENNEVIYKFSKSYNKSDYLNLYSDSISETLVDFIKISMKEFKSDIEKSRIELYSKTFVTDKSTEKPEKIISKDNYIMVKILTKDDEINKDTIKVIQNGVEEILTENKFSLISKEVQEQTLKEQAEQRKTECYDESCLVEVGKMIAAKNLLIIEIIKSEETYMFNLKFVDLETGATLKSKSSVYDNNIKNIKELLIFSKELTQNIIK